MRLALLTLAAVTVAFAAIPAAGAALGFDFKTAPCRFTGAFDVPDLNRPCDPAPRNATTGEFYNFQIADDETEACCPITVSMWYWVKVDKTNWLGSTRPGAPPAPGPLAEPAANLPSSVPVGASDPFNEDGKPPSGAGARSLAAAAGVAVGALAALL